MSGLPEAGRRWIPDSKLQDYFLNADHKRGKSKHDFLVLFGFSRTEWRILKSALMAHAETAEVYLGRTDRWGHTYGAKGPLASPDGRNPHILAYWIVRFGDSRPQLTGFIPWPAGGKTTIKA